MTPEEQIAKMEKEISDVNEKVDTILQLVKEMNIGIYGDAKNRHRGVIDKQNDLEGEIDDIRKQIFEINKRTDDRDLEVKTKITFKSELIEGFKETFKFCIKAVIIYLILKGVLGPDTLLKL